MISSCFFLRIFHCYWFSMDWLVFALNLNCPKKHQRGPGVSTKEFEKNSYTWVWIWYLKKVFFTSAEKPWQFEQFFTIIFEESLKHEKRSLNTSVHVCEALEPYGPILGTWKAMPEPVSVPRNSIHIFYVWCVCVNVNALLHIHHTRQINTRIVLFKSEVY